MLDKYEEFDYSDEDPEEDNRKQDENPDDDDKESLPDLPEPEPFTAFISYDIWHYEYGIDSLETLCRWFLDENNRKEIEYWDLDDETCVRFFLEEMPSDRSTAEEILRILSVWEPQAIFIHLLRNLHTFLTAEEIKSIMDRSYAILMHQNRIRCLEDLYVWFTEELWLGRSVPLFDRRAGLASKYLQDYLESMPLTRKSAEEIMNNADLFHSDELYSALTGRFRLFLSEKEIQYYL